MDGLVEIWTRPSTEFRQSCSSDTSRKILPLPFLGIHKARFPNCVEENQNEKTKIGKALSDKRRKEILNVDNQDG